MSSSWGKNCGREGRKGWREREIEEDGDGEFRLLLGELELEREREKVREEREEGIGREGGRGHEEKTSYSTSKLTMSLFCNISMIDLTLSGPSHCDIPS